MIKMHENNIQYTKKDMNDTINEHEIDFNMLKEMYDNQMKDEDDKCVMLEEDIIRADVITNL